MGCSRCIRVLLASWLPSQALAIQWTHSQRRMVQIDMAQIGVMVSIITGVAGQLTLHPVHTVRQRVLQGMHLMVTKVVTILLAAWLLVRIVIPVCAARMTSQVLELLLEPKIHLPGSRPKLRPGKYLSCCSIAVPLQESGVTWFG